MNQFVAIFQKPMPEDLNIDNLAIIDHYKLSDCVLLLRSILTSPQAVAALLQLAGQQGTYVGVVLKLEGSYYGYHDSELWNWLEIAHTSADVSVNG